MIRIFLDSGAYSLYHHSFKKAGGNKDYNHVETDEFWKYVDSYAEYVKENEHLVDVYVNVDVIFNPEATWRVQKYLEDTHKLKPLPVFHFGEDIKWFKKYLDNHEYIGISGVGKETPLSTYVHFAHNIFDLVCFGKKRLPRWRIHGFAMTSPDLLFRYPWYSIDSTSWVQFSKFGAIIVPKTFQKKPKYDVSPNVIFLSERSPKQREINGWHYARFEGGFKNEILKYIEQFGFILGKSEMVDGKENVIEPGLCNDHKLRDKFNLMYFLELEKTMPNWPRPFYTNELLNKPDSFTRDYSDDRTRLYLAGNFPQLKNPELEKEMAKFVVKKYSIYNRLITFFFKDDMQSILDLKKEELNESRSPKIVKRIKRS